MQTTKDLNHKYGTSVTVWQENNQWFGCWHGTYRGLYSESDDIELNATNEQSALKEIEEMFVEWRETL